MDTRPAIEKTIAFINKLRKTYRLETNHDAVAPLLYVGVASSKQIDQIHDELVAEFGEPLKPQGSTAFWMNLFNPFVRRVGGAKTDQTLFRRDLSPTVAVFCALWPWGSDPNRTSVRIGVYCDVEAEHEELVKAFGSRFM